MDDLKFLGMPPKEPGGQERVLSVTRFSSLYENPLSLAQQVLKLRLTYGQLLSALARRQYSNPVGGSLRTSPAVKRGS